MEDTLDRFCLRRRSFLEPKLSYKPFVWTKRPTIDTIFRNAFVESRPVGSAPARFDDRRFECPDAIYFRAHSVTRADSTCTRCSSKDDIA